jgi:hypothetical protein
VTLGKTNKQNEEINVLATEIIVHPDFKFNVELHDLAIVKIPGVHFSRKQNKKKY